MSKPNPAPWEYEDVQNREERSAYGVVKDANGKILFDSLNSDVAEIHEEGDEEGFSRWDETARVNLTLAAAAPELLARCEETVALLRDQLGGKTDGLHSRAIDLFNAIRVTISKAKGAVGT